MRESAEASQRLDRWLWAARFFKTRSSAGSAVSGGKVSIDGVKPKPSRKVRVGTVIVIERGAVTFEVQVRALNERRRSATEAQAMYQETDVSIARRNDEQARRALQQQKRQRALGRPDRDERRELARLKGRL